MQKIKMKLNFEARQTHLHLSHMIQLAIFRTLIEKQRIASSYLQQALKIDSQAMHSVFYKSVDPRTNTLREPNSDEQTSRLANLIKHHTRAFAKGEQ